MLKKKYTMDEFREMYDKAQIQTINKMEEDFEKSTNSEDQEMKFVYTLQNILVTAMLRKTLFEEGE